MQDVWVFFYILTSCVLLLHALFLYCTYACFTRRFAVHGFMLSEERICASVHVCACAYVCARMRVCMGLSEERMHMRIRAQI